MPRKSARALWTDHVNGRNWRAPVAVAAAGGRPFAGIVLGIDPSLRGSGFALLEYPAGSNGRVLRSETLKLGPHLPMTECLGAISKRVGQLVDEYAVAHVAIEQTIHVQNFQTAQIMGASRGAAIGAAVVRGAAVFEYAPLRIKQAVVGLGRASKVQVARTVRSLTGADLEERLDESDAAAVALCHALTWRE